MRLIWTESGELVEPQLDLFHGWQPYSGSFDASGIVTESGVCSMDVGGFPNGDGESSACSLAEILETESDWLRRNPGKSRADWMSYLQEYCLSREAAEGVQRRAENRRTKLPSLLQMALEAVIDQK